MGRKTAVVALALFLVGGAGFAAVTKTTTTNPTSFTSSFSGSVIGVAVGLKGPAGPGVYASSSAAGLSVLSGSLSKSTQAGVWVDYDQASGGTFYRFVTAVVVGISYSYAKSFSLWIISAGSMTCTNKLEYAIAEDEDGVVTVGPSGVVETSATASNSGSQSKFKPLFKLYASLMSGSSYLTMAGAVKSTATITATPLSTGLANGQAAVWIFGLP